MEIDTLCTKQNTGSRMDTKYWFPTSTQDPGSHPEQNILVPILSIDRSLKEFLANDLFRSRQSVRSKTSWFVF